MQKTASRLLFRAVCLSFSALLVLLSLLCGIRTTAVNDRAAQLKKEISALESENEILRAEYDSILSLEELERLAIEELGMQRCTPEQIQIIELPG